MGGGLMMAPPPGLQEEPQAPLIEQARRAGLDPRDFIEHARDPRDPRNLRDPRDPRDPLLAPQFKVQYAKI